MVGLIRHMQRVDDYREVLGRLQAAWDTLTLLGQLTGTAAEMSGTREALENLTGDLLNHLGQETVARPLPTCAPRRRTASTSSSATCLSGPLTSASCLATPKSSSVSTAALLRKGAARS